MMVVHEAVCGRLTVGQDVETLFAAHKVIDGLSDRGQITQVDVYELESPI